MKIVWGLVSIVGWILKSYLAMILLLMHKMKRECPNIGDSLPGVSIDPAVMDSCSVYPSVLTVSPSVVSTLPHIL